MGSENGFGSRSTAEEVTEGVDGSGLTAIVTGATNGIGKETARVFAKRGVHVFLCARNLEAAEKVKGGIMEETPTAKLDLLEVDLSSLESVRTAANHFLALNLPLNILVNNAGTTAIPFRLSKDGIEMQFATNYLGHFLLTNLLLEKLKATAKDSGIEGKIVNVSSKLHQVGYKEGIQFETLNDKKKYSMTMAYGQSKVAQILMTKELSQKLQEGGVDVTVNALHPGLIKTNLINSTNHGLFMRAFVWIVLTVPWPFLKSIPQGAATQCFVALNPLAKGVTGKYFTDCKEIEPSDLAKNADLAKRLWDFSSQLTSA